MAKRLAAASLCAVLSLSSPAAAGRTTVTVLELGPGGPAVHRTTSPDAEVPASAVASLWDALHPASGRQSQRRRAAAGTAPGMTLSSDPFVSPDAGLVVGLTGPAAGRAVRSLLESSAGAGARVVGTVDVAGENAHRDLMRAAGAVDGGVEKAAEAALGGKGAMGAASLAVEDGEAASEALVRALEAMKSSGKSAVFHLVVDEGEREEDKSARRRLEGEDEQAEGDGEGEEDQQSSSSYSSNYKTMYEIQTFNLYLWTSVGLVTILFMVMGAFVDMRLFPDTLLHGAVTKVAD